MNPYSFAPLLFSFCSLFLGVFVWLKRMDRISAVYFIFNFFASAWAFCYFFMMIETESYERGLLLCRFTNASSIIVPVAWYHLSLVFRPESSNIKVKLCVGYLLATLFSVLSFSDYFVPSVREMGYTKFTTVAGPLYNIYTIYFWVLVFLGFFVFIKKARVAVGQERKSVIGLLVAVAFGFFGGGITFLPVYGIEIPIIHILFMPIYPFVMAYFMTRENLFDAEKFAELAHLEKMQTIAALASSINHEIRNPLYIVKSQAEVLLDKSKEVDSESKDVFVEKTHAQMTRAMDIMKRFSSFAKGGSEAEVKKERVNLNAVLEDVLKLVSYEVEMNKIKVFNELDKETVVVFDPRHLEQVFFNLIRNACQEIGEGGEIIIESKKVDERVEVVIRDSGPGIPEERLSQIFEPFYSTKKEGSGVGLYVTEHLVERSGGQIGVKSRLGEGTAFKLNLISASDDIPKMLT